MPYPVEGTLLWIMGSVLFPLWLAAGVADYFCHRASHIETTSGLPEAVAHLVLASLMGIGVFVLLFLEINAFALALLVTLFVAHEVVTYLDLTWAAPRREILPIEQLVHSFLECVPFAVVVAVALLVFGTEKTAFVLELKRTPIAPSVIAAILSAMTAFGAVPYWEEAWRCWRRYRFVDLA